MNRSTYIIRRSQIEKVFNMGDCVSAVEKVFGLYGEGEVQMPPKVYLSFPKGDLRTMPAYIPSEKMAGVKNVNSHPGNRELPAVMATITLVDPETGFPLAIMDGTLITSMRTGAASAVAAKYLSREDAKVAAFVGTGAQAVTQLEGLLTVRPGIARVKMYDINEAMMKSFRQAVSGRHGPEMECVASVKEAVEDADIVTTITPVRSPIVKTEYIRKGTHINAIGADAEGKQELDLEILKKAKIVIDDWAQASHGGEINVALARRIIRKEDIHADIGEIVSGKKPGRESDDEITVFDSTGLAIQDISSASAIYKKLMANKELEAELEKVQFG